MNEVDHLIGFADVLAVTTDGGEVRIRIGDAVLQQGFGEGIPAYGPDGFIGVQNLPTEDGKSAQLMYVQDGNRKICIGSRDNRFKEKIGTGKPGDRMIITDGEARFMIKQERDAVTLYTVNQDADKSMMLDLDGSAGQALWLNAEAFIRLMKDEIVLAVNGGGAIRISKDGVQVTGGSFQAVCGAVQLGDMGGGIAPPPTPASAVAITVAGPVNTVSTKVFAAL